MYRCVPEVLTGDSRVPDGILGVRIPAKTNVLFFLLFLSLLSSSVAESANAVNEQEANGSRRELRGREC